MILKSKVVLSASFIHKRTGSTFDIDKVIEKEYNEDSEEFKELILAYEGENQIQITRDDSKNKDEYDKLFLEWIADLSKESCSAIVKNISDIFKEHCKTEASGFIEFGGWILKVQDFSGVLIKDLQVKISKH